MRLMGGTREATIARCRELLPDSLPEMSDDQIMDLYWRLVTLADIVINDVKRTRMAEAAAGDSGDEGQRDPADR